jgi:hypothetical protein
MKALLPVAIAVLLTACTLPGSTPPASISVATTPIIVTEDNYAQAYTNMRFAAIQKKAGGVNKILEMPVPPSDPAKQFVVRMNRDTFYSVGIVDLSKGNGVRHFITDMPSKQVGACAQRAMWRFSLGNCFLRTAKLVW